jgi:hypothetical protein
MPGGSLIRDVDLRSAPELYPGELQDVGPQFLLARRKRRPPQPVTRHHWIEAFADWQLFYTNNALLSEKRSPRHRCDGDHAAGRGEFPHRDAFRRAARFQGGYRHQWWMYSLDKTGTQLNNSISPSARCSSPRAIRGRISGSPPSASITIATSPTRMIGRSSTSNSRRTGPSNAILIDEKTIFTTGYYGAYHWTQTDPPGVSYQ